MPFRTTKLPLLNYNKSSPGASSTGFEFPKSPSLKLEDGFRQRSASPRTNSFSEKKPEIIDLPSPCSPHTPVNIKPYIGLRSKLSLAWVNYTVVALIFIILRLFIAMKSIGPIVDEVKDKAIRTCDALEVATSTVTSLPHFMADGFNKATVDSVNFTIKGAAKTLDILIVMTEGIIVWLIHVFRSTYRCILEFALKASVGSVTESVKVLGDFTQGRLNDIKNQLNSDLSNVNSVIDQIKGAASKIPGFSIDIPSVSISTDSLNIQLPTSNIVSGLDSLNGNNIPLMDQIETDITNLISIPFNELRGFVNDSMSNVKFNQTVLPVPPKNQISFCAENLDLSILDNIARDLIKAAYIGLGIIFFVVLLMIACNALVTWFSHIRYKSHIRRTTTTIKMLTIKADKDSVIEVLKIAEHPLISRWIIKGSKFFKNLENRNLFRWFFDYIFHKPALICLLIGSVGVMGVYLQIAVLHTVKQNYKQPIANAVGDFGNSVTNLINSQLASTSTKFASDSNSVISSLESGINQDLLGWVNTTTTTLNDTLNAAVDEITKFIQTTFKDVPIFATIVQELVNCLIVVKIEGIQAGLTFIKENAFIGLPRVNDTVLLISRGSTDEAVGQATSRLIGSSPSDIRNGDGEIGGEIGKIFDIYEENLRAELPLFYTLITIWFVVILMGIIRVLWFIYKRRKNRNKKVDTIKRSLSASAAQQNDLTQLSKSIKDDDENNFDAFRFKMKSLKNNRSSQKNMVNPTYPRIYSPPQPDEKGHDDGNNKQHRPPRPPLPAKPIRLQRHDIRNKDPFSGRYNNYYQ